MPARFRGRFHLLFRRADTVRGREQLFGGDDLVVAGAEQEDRMAQGGKIDLPPHRKPARNETAGNGAPERAARAMGNWLAPSVQRRAGETDTGAESERWRAD